MQATAWILLMLGLVAIALDLHVTMHGLLAALGLSAVVVALAWLAFMTLSPLGAGLILVGLSGLAVRIGPPLFRSWRELLEREPAPEFSSEVARAVEGFDAVGLVRVDGILWRAVSVAGPVVAGQAVRILARRRLSVLVIPVTSEEASGLEVLASS